MYFEMSGDMRLEITRKCNRRCPNCNHYCWIPTREEMTLEQIEAFGKEQANIRSIYISGGEPTMHSKLKEAYEIIKKWYPSKEIFVISNLTEYAKRVLKNIPELKLAHHSGETLTKEFMIASWAPQDFYNFSDSVYEGGCDFSFVGGPTLGSFGWYMCPDAPGIDVVFGFNLGVKRASDLTPDVIKAQRRIFCKLCGSFFQTFGKYTIAGKIRQVSPTWEKQFAKSEIQKPQLTRYA